MALEPRVDVPHLFERFGRQLLGHRFREGVVTGPNPAVLPK